MSYGGCQGAADYEDATAHALPDSVTVSNGRFGPHTPAPGEWDGYPTTESGSLDIQAIVTSVDFWWSSSTPPRGADPLL